MGFVLQMQRRAIEAFKDLAVGHQWPAEAFQKQDARFCLGQKTPGWSPTEHLVYLGLSQGYGTCSDIHGMDIAVFGPMPSVEWRLKQEREGIDWRWEDKPNWTRLAACAYGVLLWPNGDRAIPILENLTGQNGLTMQRIGLDTDESYSFRQAQSTVELLQYTSFESLSFTTRKGECHFTNIFLTRTGLIVSYINL